MEIAEVQDRESLQRYLEAQAFAHITDGTFATRRAGALEIFQPDIVLQANEIWQQVTYGSKSLISMGGAP